MMDPDFFDTHDFADTIADAEPADWERSPMTAFTVRLPQSVLSRLRIDAERRNMPTGELIRKILTEAVSDATSGEKTIPVSALRELIAQAS